MPTLTIKNIPEDIYRQLKRQAALNRRSLNSEVLICIERAVRSTRMSPEAVLTRARQLRQKTTSHPINDAEFDLAKSQGRP